MRPIDYAIKLIAAFNMSTALFNDLTESLYYESDRFMYETLNCLEEQDSQVFNEVLDAFSHLDEM